MSTGHDDSQAPGEGHGERDSEAPTMLSLLPEGNTLRARGLAPLLVGLNVGVIIMASQASARVMVPVALLAVMLLIIGVFDVLGSFDDPEETRAFHCSARELAMPLTITLGSAGLQLLCLRAAVHGSVPPALSAIVMPLGFLLMVVGLYRCGERLGPWRLDEDGKHRPLWRRHGFWLVVIITLLYLPMLGNHSLSDPWETHYGEVAREILARNDWISLWWAQDGWFWSKPVLSFWLQALAMALLGVRYEPGEMLSSAADGLTPQPEWAVRMPIFLITVLGVYFLYKAVARSHGRRAGLLGGVVLVTMPQFFLIAHQTMTDMPFVACTAASVGLFAFGVQLDPEARIKTYELRAGALRLRVSLFHLVLGAVLLVVLPQILYLLSRNISIFTSPYFDIRVHGDVFSSGSIGNCGLPGNDACREGLTPVMQKTVWQPALQALPWLLELGLLLWLSWGERRQQRLVFVAAWLFAALACMAKGPAGLGLPVLAALSYVLATRKWRDLTRVEIASGSLIVTLVVLPWFMAMVARHGQPFADRIVFHDMWKRVTQHVHDTNTGDDVSFRYYVWQLGYAAFPWTGLVPVALVRWLRREPDEGEASDARFGTSVTLAAWFFIGFALFAVMGTKFHHYCLPIVPPMAMLTGVLLDDMIRSRTPSSNERRSANAPFDALLLGAVAIGAALLTFSVGSDMLGSDPERLGQVRLLHLFSYNYTRPWPDTLDFSVALWCFAVAAGVLTALLVVERWRRVTTMALCGCALLFAAWGLDVYLVKLSPHWGQRELFIAYQRERATAPGQLVAYQMNWKGENFYSGNKLPAFVSSGQKFQDWIAEQKKAGDKIFYFVTEHKRARILKDELGTPQHFDRLTDEALNNKFLLIRVRFD